MSLLEIENLKTHFETRVGTVKAVDGINLYMDKGDALGLVGESGCGKTTTMLSLMRLLPPNGQIVDGKILFDGIDLISLDEATLRKDIYWKRMSMVFQGAMNALNPVFRVGGQIVQALTIHEDINKEDAWKRVEDLFSLVGIDHERAKDYPHELSGGMKQRAIIAMALACNPDLIIADEPVTALDVIVQAQILELIRDLQKKLKLSIIMITHDLSVVADVCNKAAIMYAGKIVEVGDIVTIFKKPKHPYSQGLLTNYPSIREEKMKFMPIKGRPPNLISPPPGCRFHPRCPYAMEICNIEEPKTVNLEREHYAACHLITL
jgi:peptide/nickel transport system ATP-binding protein